MTATIERAGFLSSVQDLGRIGHRGSGVSVGGALDPHALRVVNLLVGNAESAAGIEITLGQVRIKFDDKRVVAWAGGRYQVNFGEYNLPAGRPALLRAGEELVVRLLTAGGRAWLAISGGIDVPLVLGSRATDLRNHFGGWEGRALRDLDRLELGEPSAQAKRIAMQIGSGRVANWGAEWQWVETTPPHPFLRVVHGTDWEFFDEEAMAAFRESVFQVTPESDRMGVRLGGPKLAQPKADDLLSEAVVPGTIQIPPDGQPLLLLGDCQTVGGYPKIAHVITVDLPWAVQLQAGAEVRFVEVALEEAQSLLRQRARDLKRFRLGLELRTA